MAPRHLTAILALSMIAALSFFGPAAAQSGVFTMQIRLPSGQVAQVPAQRGKDGQTFVQIHMQGRPQWVALEWLRQEIARGAATATPTTPRR